MNIIYKITGYFKYIYLKNFGSYDTKLEIDRLENLYDYNVACGNVHDYFDEN